MTVEDAIRELRYPLRLRIDPESRNAFLGAVEMAIDALREQPANDQQIKNALRHNGFQTFGEFLEAYQQMKRVVKAYQDTGLTPEEITQAANRRHDCKIDCLLKEYNRVAKELETLRAQQELKSPCDLCRYNPPSSFGGKPCAVCPASQIVKEET